MSSFYPGPPVESGHVEPAPRRVRGVVDGRTVFDTTAAHYVWLQPYYPQYLIPRADCEAELLDRLVQAGTARLRDADAPGIAGAIHFDWDALDEWYEEDEQIFVHPRSPYVRVDAIRSSRAVRIELGGVVLAESPAPVMLFETGLPTRYYVDPSRVAFEHLCPSDTESSCPYKGTTSNYWSATLDGETVDDVAWSYDFPVAQVQPIIGLVAFYNERVDVFIDGHLQPRPEVRAPGQR